MVKTLVKDIGMVDKVLSYVRSLVKELMKADSLLKHVGETLERTRARLEAVDRVIGEGVLPSEFKEEVYEWRRKMKGLRKVVEEEVMEVLKKIR